MEITDCSAVHSIKASKMTPNQKTVLVVAALVALCIASLFWNVDWDARAIDKQLNELADLVEKSEPESAFEALGRSRRVADLFTDSCEIEYLPQRSSLSGADSISAAFLSVRNAIETASVGLSQHTIAVDAGAARAESSVRASAKVATRGGDEWRDRLNYRIVWEKVEGEWLIRQIWIKDDR
ncbi:Unannotated [Lentimonas sp. CC19]|nr:Unannotated [Lentimonas sp. CC19]CAA6695766.1 Unannotated [Lentimonas sp. CC10]CAA7069597.1 Unannotated [Lentimonas sp. CC11]